MNDQILFNRLTPGQNVPRPPFNDVAVIYDSDQVFKVVDGNTGQQTPLIPPNPGGFDYIVKSVNQDVTNAGVTNDTEFFFPVVAGGRYAIIMDLFASGNNTAADYTSDFAVSAGTMRGKGTHQGLSAAAAVSNVIVTAAGAANTTAIPTGVATADLNDLVYVSYRFAFSVTNDATFRFRFGNATPTSAAISRTWKGSVLRYKSLD
jgi:hypothetical protein